MKVRHIMFGTYVTEMDLRRKLCFPRSTRISASIASAAKSSSAGQLLESKGTLINLADNTM